LRWPSATDPEKRSCGESRPTWCALPPGVRVFLTKVQLRIGRPFSTAFVALPRLSSLLWPGQDFFPNTDNGQFKYVMARTLLPPSYRP